MVRGYRLRRFRGKPLAWVMPARAIGRAGATQPVLRYHRSNAARLLEQSDHGATRHTLQGIDDFIEGYLATSGGLSAYCRRGCRARVVSGQCVRGLLWMLLEAPEGARFAANI